jgi:serine/threonine-protein kinase
MADRAGSTPPIPPADSFTGPTRIGPYAIISDLGHGGMGTVYLAQHTQLGRIVALKVIPSGGSATSDREMRFLREARTVARLSHPHIVVVHDAGRDHGHAYFAMDYFEDGDLARRLRAQPFSPRDAAQLLHLVAGAIAFSHAAGVLHRDLKPSNILLSAGAPHVADFGLAAELDSSGGLTARTTVLGTPHYLAPEALSRGSVAQGVASDVYSLGVILHEMLTGRTPFAGASPAELPGLLARGEAPDLRLLAPQVPADLVTICAKCLEFDPSRRYATAADLTEDLRRFLAGESIKARPVSAAHRLLRWTRRRPALAATWVLSFLLAVGSLTAATLINRERLRASAAAEESAALSEFFQIDLLQQGADASSLNRDLKLRTAMERSEKFIATRFANAPLAEISVRQRFASIYYSLGEHIGAERQLRPAVALLRHERGSHHPATQYACSEWASVLNELGRASEAAALIRSAVPDLVAALGAEHPHAIGALEVEAVVERDLGHTARAEALARRALDITQRTLPRDHELRRTALVNFSKIVDTPAKLPEVEIAAREALAIAERIHGPTHHFTLSSRVDVAANRAMQGKAEEAVEVLRELHASLAHDQGPDDHATLRALGNLGYAQTRLGQHDEAEKIFSELVAARLRLLPTDHPLTLLAKRHLILARGRNNQLPQAIDEMRELSELCAKALGPTHATTLANLRNLAAMLQSAGRYPESLAPVAAAYTGSAKELGDDDEATLAIEETYAGALMQTNQLPLAETRWRHVAEVVARTQPDQWRAYYLRGQLAKTIARQGRHAEAEPALRESYAGLIARQSELPANRRPALKALAETLATVCTALGRPAEAAEWQAKAAAP